MDYTLTGNIGSLTDRGLAEAFMAGQASGQADLSWIRIVPWDSMTYKTAQYTPPSGYAANANEGADIPTESIDQVNPQTISLSGFTLGYGTSLESRLTMPRDALMQVYRQLGALGVRFFAEQSYGLLNNCTVAGVFGEALASTTHSSGVGAQSNFLNSALDFASFESGVRTLMTTQNYRGTVMAMRPTKLVVPAALNVTGYQILAASFDADDRSKPNPNAGLGVSLTVSPDLSSSTRWFLFDENSTSFVAPVLRGPAPWEIPFESKSGRYEVRDRVVAGFGWGDWRGVVVG